MHITWELKGKTINNYISGYTAKGEINQIITGGIIHSDNKEKYFRNKIIEFRANCASH